MKLPKTIQGLLALYAQIATTVNSEFAHSDKLTEDEDRFVGHIRAEMQNSLSELIEVAKSNPNSIITDNLIKKIDMALSFKNYRRI